MLGGVYFYFYEKAVCEKALFKKKSKNVQYAMQKSCYIDPSLAYSTYIAKPN